MFFGRFKSRYTVIFIVIVLVVVAFVSRLFNLQIVQGEYYSKQSQNRLLKNMPVKAPRGEIFDRYGRPLVTNRQGFSVVFHREYMKKDEINGIILNMVELFSEYGEEYIESFPISQSEPFEFEYPTLTAEERAERIKKFNEANDIDENKTAPEVIDHFASKYDISDEYTKEEIRKIAGIRYEMENRGFSYSTPYTFATDVPIEIVTCIREQSDKFTGVNISVEPIREYPNGSMLAHVLGRVGVIYKEEYEQLKDKDYSMTDLVGKDGIEKILEEHLKGKDGVSSVEQNLDGRVSRIMQTKEAKPGKYAVLTIDAELQATLEESLARTIRQLSQSPGTYDAKAGSGVVIDVRTGEILAIASYPSFNPATFNEDWDKISRDDAKPMWNRAISGQYAPGSTFKMLTAIAALEEGHTTTKEVIVDEGIYEYYDYDPVCWYYSDYGKGHGPQTITQAIENSCNYFFYEVGKRMGIETLNKYGKIFGLGEYTGIELSGEAKGVFASKEYKEKTNRVWYPGDTLQASIGQSDHLFTPIQLANYIATIANGGTRYEAHIIKDVKPYDSAESAVKIEPKVADRIEMSEENYRAIMDGMRKVSETGTASNVFADFEIPVGGKTGTASVPNGTANGLFTAFAPFDDPQIAIAVVVEHGAHGNSIAPIARDVIAKYMSVDTVEDEIEVYNKLIR